MEEQLEQLLNKCRDLLEDVTPLQKDCGLLCQAACCRPLEGEETGMLLFPGEECLYKGDPAFRLLPGAGGTLCICSGRCERRRRPLACRLFPVLPVVSGGRVSVEMDARAASVCPLAQRGLQALSRTFLMRARQAGEWLNQNEQTRQTLLFLSQQQKEMRLLRRRFGVSGRY